MNRHRDVRNTQTLANENVQAIMSKSIVPDLEWFDSDQTKFEVLVKEVLGYSSKVNKVIETV